MLVERAVRTMINRIFGYERIDGTRGCEYLHRWCLLVLPRGVRVYLHKFVGSDSARDLHDHPKRFISIGLWGSYIEETVNRDAVWFERWKDVRKRRRYRAPWIRSFPAEHIHRLILDCPVCWTLVLTLPESRPWGFWVRGEWIPWRKYVYYARADEAKDC